MIESTIFKCRVITYSQTEKKTERMIHLAKQNDETACETQQRLERLESTVYKVVSKLDVLDRNWVTWQSPAFSRIPSPHSFTL